MPLALNTDYENVFFDVVLDGLRDILISEYNYGKIYISPEIKHNEPFGIRLWGTESNDEVFTVREWQKRYEVDIIMYHLESNPDESFYKQYYQDSERLHQIIHNNQTKTITIDGRSYTWLSAEIDNIEYNSDEEAEEDIKGLHSINHSFSCLVSRES